MICPKDRTQMVNFTKETTKKFYGMAVTGGQAFKNITEIVPLPNGGIATDELYETWYIYECPKCGRRVKEAYRCELLD